MRDSQIITGLQQANQQVVGLEGKVGHDIQLLHNLNVLIKCRLEAIESVLLNDPDLMQKVNAEHARLLMEYQKRAAEPKKPEIVRAPAIGVLE